ncbi:hypothetical protein K2173_028380 [Erythroxylum novogranatense]|uniref:Uncharacterized protein n=1 Tax=Erythroxylum novogranatense TaxID=1862640 RepID=A0AAV8U1Y7_9ROSI|nr:hypothetical protein K2173_028380 [Erythroxylum novogranatense]
MTRVLYSFGARKARKLFPPAKEKSHRNIQQAESTDDNSSKGVDDVAGSGGTHSTTSLLSQPL